MTSKNLICFVGVKLQGTASVVLAGLIAAQKVLGKSLADHTFLFLGAGEVRPENIYQMNFFLSSICLFCHVAKGFYLL